jgi:hypothetical protein
LFLAAERRDPETLGWADQRQNSNWACGPSTEYTLGQDPAGTTLRIADGEEYSAPATIHDQAVLDEISDALERIGYCPGVS